MRTLPRTALSQPHVGVATSGCALAVLGACWAGAAAADWRPDPLHALIAVALIAATILAYQFPIQIHYHHRIEVGSVPIYLMAVVLPVPLAATAAGLGILAAELSVHRRRGSYASDIATAAARWVLITVAGSLLAHQADGALTTGVALVGAAAMLWAGDMLTLPLVLGPISGEPAALIIRRAARETGAAEGTQYLIGMAGALAALQQVWTLALLALPTAILYLAFKRTKELHENTRQLLESMADLVDLRDPYTGGHSRRVTELSAEILDALPDQEPDGYNRRLILAAARVHDIGKIGIPDQVLKKAGPLTPEERAIMETHPERGATLLARYPDFALGAEIVRHHHERWDGEGYPARLRGPAIPLGARVIAVADSFDAMTTNRPYRRALSVKKAVEILRAGRGTQWDPLVVDAFLHSVAAELERSPALQLTIVGDAALADREAALA